MRVPSTSSDSTRAFVCCSAVPTCFRTKKEQLETFQRLYPESRGRNLALTA